MRRSLRSLAMTSRGPSANAFSAAAARHADALMVLDDALLFHTRAQIADLGAKSRLPTMFGDADGRGHPLTREDQHTSCKVSKVGFILPYAQPPAPLPVATHAIIIDTAPPSSYNRARDLSKDTTMTRRIIALIVILTLGRRDSHGQHHS
jgi:hypothetical protein